jgi:hypothetical protein
MCSSFKITIFYSIVFTEIGNNDEKAFKTEKYWVLKFTLLVSRIKITLPNKHITFDRTKKTPCKSLGLILGIMHQIKLRIIINV